MSDHLVIGSEVTYSCHSCHASLTASYSAEGWVFGSRCPNCDTESNISTYDLGEIADGVHSKFLPEGY